MRDDAHAVTAAQIGHTNLTELEGFRAAGGHHIQQFTEGDIGLEMERAGEAGAPGWVGAGTDGDFKGSLGEQLLHDNASVGDFGGWPRCRHRHMHR